jgi:hypothetical protein
MKDLSQRAKERAEQTAKTIQEQAAAGQRAKEHAKELDQNIRNYLRGKTILRELVHCQIIACFSTGLATVAAAL